MNKQNLKIGDVIWIKLHGENHVQRGVRPAIIVQNNKGNMYSPTLQVVPLTSKCTKNHLPTHVFIDAGTAGLSKNSIAQCEGIRTVDKVDVLGFIGHLPDSYMALIAKAIIISMPIIQYLALDQIYTLHQQVSTAMM